MMSGAGGSRRKARRVAEAARGDNRDSGVPDTHSFVLKVWVESRCDSSGVARWRGSITHVPSGRTIYFEDLNDMCGFVVSHMQQS